MSSEVDVNTAVTCPMQTTNKGLSACGSASGQGECDEAAGTCSCSLGWTGASCSEVTCCPVWVLVLAPVMMLLVGTVATLLWFRRQRQRKQEQEEKQKRKESESVSSCNVNLRSTAFDADESLLGGPTSSPTSTTPSSSAGGPVARVHPVAQLRLPVAHQPPQQQHQQQQQQQQHEHSDDASSHFMSKPTTARSAWTEGASHGADQSQSAVRRPSQTVQSARSYPGHPATSAEKRGDDRRPKTSFATAEREREREREAKQLPRSRTSISRRGDSPPPAWTSRTAEVPETSKTTVTMSSAASPVTAADAGGSGGGEERAAQPQQQATKSKYIRAATTASTSTNTGSRAAYTSNPSGSSATQHQHPHSHHQHHQHQQHQQPPHASRSYKSKTTFSVAPPEADLTAKALAVRSRMEAQLTDPIAVRKQTFRELVLEYHPDKNPDSEAKEVFQMVNNSRSWFLHDQ